jgi:hypothetical protein
VTDAPDDKPISLNKQTSPKAKIEPVPLPQTIRGALIAMLVFVVTTIASALALLGSTSTLDKYLVSLNNKAKKKDKKVPYTPAEIAKDLHSLRIETISIGIVVSVLVLGITWAMRRPGTASATRWLFLVLMVLSGAIFRVVPIKGYPALAKGIGVLTGLSAVAALVLIFLPASAVYFKACREAVLPPERRGLPATDRPRLFGPRPAAQRPGTAGTARPSAPRQSAPAAGRGKAKVRSDSEAIARGAELARTRAKASKSRRTDV